MIINRLRSLWAYLRGTTAPIALAVEDTAPRGIRISPAAEWEARRNNAPRILPDQVFARAQPTPGVVPSGMAMDEAGYGGSAISNWAADSPYHEGLGFLGYPYLAQLAQRAEYRMIAEKWAEHATRRWIKLTGDDVRVNAITTELERLNVRAIFREAAENDGLAGRSHIFMDFDDADDVPEVGVPLVIDPGKISPKRPLKRLKHIEALWAYPGPYNTRNPLAADFYRPMNWYIYGVTVHISRLLTFVGREVPDVLKPAYAFGGLALTQMAKPYVDNWLRTRQSVSDMVHSFSTMVLKTNLENVLSGDPADDLFKRIDIFNATRDNRGCMVIDKNSEELENVAVPMAGLDKLQAQALEQLSTVSGIPIVILLGQTPSGLNASSDGEIRSFYAAVKALQDKIFREPLERLVKVVQLSLFGDIDDTIKVEFEPLWEIDDAEAAATRKSDAETDAAYIAAGVVDAEEVRERLREDKTSLYHGVDLSGAAPDQDDDDEKIGGDPDLAFAGDGWNEGDHPRDDKGKFGALGGRSASSPAKTRLYHGTTARFDKLRASESGSWGGGVYLTDDRPTAEKWAPALTGGRLIETEVEGPILDLRKSIPNSVVTAFRAELESDDQETLDYYIDDKGYSPAEAVGLLAQTSPDRLKAFRGVLEQEGYVGLTAKLLSGSETVIFNAENVAHASQEEASGTA